MKSLKEKYIMLLKQSGEGCDYSIGCGMLWEVVETENLQEKIRETIENFGADGSGEVEFERMVFVPFNAGTVIEVDLKECVRQIKESEAEKDQADIQKEEMNEYARLKAKYGGQND